MGIGLQYLQNGLSSVLTNGLDGIRSMKRQFPQRTGHNEHHYSSKDRTQGVQALLRYKAGPEPLPASVVAACIPRSS
jgi:hypothetical protein